LFDVQEEKVSVVHLGVDVSAFKSCPALDSVFDRPFLLYVGGRGGYKNFGGFIRAFSRSNFLMKEFDIVSFGGGSFNKFELELINTLGFGSEQVRQIGGSDEQLSSLYHQAVAFVYPSLYEGFGLPPLEAMAAGCPVISSNASSMPEVIGNAGKYFNPNDLEEIQFALEKVVSSPELRSRLIGLGFKNIEKFSWQKCALETLDIYKNLTGKL
jgi:glycosyltransferase involved in cell wall biosynthesis